jgi:penicillin-binding protein 2
VAFDVKPDVFSYILENQENFPGVTVETQSLREYPFDQLGAHLFGTVGEVTEEQLKDKQRYRRVTGGDRIGQSGIEYSYDRFLRGENGAARLQVDALGKLRGKFSRKEPKAGRQLRLTIDLDVQRAGQLALTGRKGAFVVMNIKDGEVLGLGSAPSFDPNLFSKGIKQKDLDALQAKENGEPLANRATQGLYPTGSTFKLITSVAGLQGGIITPDTVLQDGGCVQVSTINFCNAGKVVHGPVALRKALTVSSDVFYYRVGAQANTAGDGLLIQKWAGRLGLGKKTGIDLPAEGEGLIPTPAWRNKLYKKDPAHQRPWSIGDNVNLAIGQGDVQANPLQMAIAYAAVGNGGFVVRPRLGLRIDSEDGGPLQEFESARPRKLGIKPEYRSAIMDGLRGAASAPGGTSTPVFKDFPVPVWGKTGTAERPGQRDQSWYVALWAPRGEDQPKYVVAVTIEQGGFGAEAAAPAARKIIAAAEDIRDRKPIVEGSAPD